MLLIDAHNIVNGGGLTLLHYLVNVLDDSQREYVIIKNTMTVIESRYAKQINCKSPFERKRILRETYEKVKPDVLFCFGNYPPRERFPVKTITYIHNPYLVTKWYKVFFKDKLAPIRQSYLIRSLKNTDYILFQNELIKEKFTTMYGHHDSISYRVVPFYDDAKIRKARLSPSDRKERFIYVSLPHPHKNHFYLLQVWKELNKKGYNPELLITIPETAVNKRLLSEIARINSLGAKIINLGILSYDEILKLTAASRYCIYPSLLETFGLGLIEAALLHCKVIAADLPYTREVIRPSSYIDPYNIQSGVNVVLEAIHSGDTLPETLPLIQNQIEDLTNLLY